MGLRLPQDVATRRRRSHVVPAAALALLAALTVLVAHALLSYAISKTKPSRCGRRRAARHTATSPMIARFGRLGAGSGRRRSITAAMSPAVSSSRPAAADCRWRSGCGVHRFSAAKARRSARRVGHDGSLVSSGTPGQLGRRASERSEVRPAARPPHEARRCSAGQRHTAGQPGHSVLAARSWQRRACRRGRGSVAAISDGVRGATVSGRIRVCGSPSPTTFR